MKQLKQLQRKPRKNSEASMGFKPMTRTTEAMNPVEASKSFLGFLNNCFSCYRTVRITFTYSIMCVRCAKSQGYILIH